jgi:hypothetical protein
VLCLNVTPFCSHAFPELSFGFFSVAVSSFIITFKQFYLNDSLIWQMGFLYSSGKILILWLK